MKTPLMPFTASAWWWILCTVAYMSIGLHVVESSSHYIEPAGETASIFPSAPNCTMLSAITASLSMHVVPWFDRAGKLQHYARHQYRP